MSTYKQLEITSEEQITPLVRIVVCTLNRVLMAEL